MLLLDLFTRRQDQHILHYANSVTHSSQNTTRMRLLIVSQYLQRRKVIEDSGQQHKFSAAEGPASQFGQGRNIVRINAEFGD